MRIGLMLGASGADDSVQSIAEAAAQAETMGFANLWLAHIMGVDAMTGLAIAGQKTTRAELGTAVVPTYPRHPIAMAQQALSTAAACNGRFVLGIGLSHKLVIEDMYGLSYDKPAAHMREYLQVLAPALRGEQVSHAGELFRANIKLSVPGAPAVPLLVAALGPVMLKIAGEMSDGTITWMTGPNTIERHILPTLSAAAAAAGRAQPRVVAGFPVALTSNVDAAKKAIGQQLSIYGMLPSYRAMLDREGAAGPADIAMVGDETALRAQIARLRDIGVTDFNAAIVPVEAGVMERTRDFLAAECA